MLKRASTDRTSETQNKKASRQGFEIIESEKNKIKRMKKRKERLHDLWDFFQRENINQNFTRRKEEAESLFKGTLETLSNLWRDQSKFRN